LRLADSGHAPGTRNYDAELRIQQLAASRKIAAPVTFANPSSGLLLSEFLTGNAWQERDLRSHANLQALAALLRRVHELPRCGQRYRAESVAVSYVGALNAQGNDDSFASRCLEVVRSIPVRDALVCCHNDIVAANVIDGQTLKLIDWEYARDNDPMFDLASLIGWHDLDECRVRVLLTAYTGSDSAELSERLLEQRRIFDAIQWLWLAQLQGRRPDHRHAMRLDNLKQRIREAAPN
jgi:thiamine kinase-like enzyme